MKVRRNTYILSLSLKLFCSEESLEIMLDNLGSNQLPLYSLGAGTSNFLSPKSVIALKSKHWKIWWILPYMKSMAQQVLSIHPIPTPKSSKVTKIQIRIGPRSRLTQVTLKQQPKTSGLETSYSEKEEMADENFDDNPNVNHQPWLLRDALTIPGRQHRLPKHRENLLPRFNPD